MMISLVGQESDRIDKAKGVVEILKMEVFADRIRSVIQLPLGKLDKQFADPCRLQAMLASVPGLASQSGKISQSHGVSPKNHSIALPRRLQTRDPPAARTITWVNGSL